MSNGVGSQSMVAPLRRVVVKRPADAFVSAAKLEAEWRDLAFTARPDLDRAVQEHAAFVAALEGRVAAGQLARGDLGLGENRREQAEGERQPPPARPPHRLVHP